jgi:proteasome lid subunit RPN8/RPN11
MARSRSQPLIITAEAYDAMIAHCVKGSALACCGFLAGVPPTASVAYPLRNAAGSRVRYVSDPRDMFRAARDLRDRGLEIVAIYHFYPQTAAIPTPTDLRENNYADLPRVIVALGERPRVRAWRLARRYCEELTWRLVPRGSDITAAWDGAGAEAEGRGGAEPPASFVARVLHHLRWWRRPSTRIPIGRLQDRPPLEPEPLWDPVLDRPETPGTRADPGTG